MEEKIKQIRDRANAIMGSIDISTGRGDAELLNYLNELENKQISNSEIDIINKTLDNIEIYFKTKRKMTLEINDYEYLKEIAKGLREQKVRVTDRIIFGEPVFKILTQNNNKEEEFYFITKQGAENFIKANPLTYKQKSEEDSSEERRKKDILAVKTNRNLELAKIIEIIKRNF